MISNLNAADMHFIFSNLKNKIDRTYYLYQDVRQYSIGYNGVGDILNRIKRDGFIINFSYPTSKFTRFESEIDISYNEQSQVHLVPDASGYFLQDSIIVNRAQTTFEPNVRYVSDHTYILNQSIAGYRNSFNYL